MTDRRCPRLWQVEALRDGRITGPEALSARSHIERCSDCTGEAGRFETLSRELRASGAAPDAMSVRRLRNAVLAQADAALHTQGRPRRWLVAAVAITGVAVMTVGAWSVRRTVRGNEQAKDFVTVSAEGARFTRTAQTGIERVDLADGTLSISTHMKPFGQRFIVRVPDGEIEDVGTVFRVAVRDGRTREIAVSEGSVVFRRSSAPEIRLSSGAVWSPAPEPTAERAVASAVPYAELIEPTTAQVPARQQPHAVIHRAESPKADIPNVERATPPSPSEDESYLRIVALLREHRAEEARVAAIDYLRRFPEGFRRAEVERLTLRRSE